MHITLPFTDTGYSRTSYFQYAMLASLPLALYYLPTLNLVLSLIVGYVISLFATFTGMHRYCSHNSYSVNKFWHWILYLAGTIQCVGAPLHWANIHLIHHEHADTEKDPHSPKHMGYIKTFFAGWFEWKHASFKNEIIKKIAKDPAAAFTDRYYVYIIISWVLIVYLINPSLIWALFFFPMFFSLVIPAVINTFSHAINGSGARNNRLLGLVLGGDVAYHQVHHDNPQKDIYQFPDLPGFMIWLIKKKVDILV